MTDFIDRLGAELARAATADARPQPRIQPPAPAEDGRARQHAKVHRRATVVFVIVALVLVAAAGAATLVLRTGTPIAPAHGASPGAGIGVPLRGQSRLLAIRVPDPNGGPPWGMRLVRTTRGLLCVQVGRIFRGQLGILGVDGAFHDDGTFHPLPARALAGNGQLGLSDEATSGIGAGDTFQQCDSPAAAFTGYSSGLTASGAMTTVIVPATQQRWISLGRLGPRAISLTYQAAAGQLTVPVQGPLGFYLLVLRGSERGAVGRVSGGALGRIEPVGDAPQPTGAVTAVTYRIGSRTCVNTPTAATSTCPQATAPPPLAVHPTLHERLHVRVRPGAPGPTVLLTFTAPYAVRSAASAYTVEQPTPCRNGTIVTRIEHNIARGARVTAIIGAAFANRCGNTITLKLLYQSGSPFTARTVVTVGQITVTAPAGLPPVVRPRKPSVP